MGRYVFVVLSNPVGGRDAEYNAWYDEVHLGDVCRFPGFTGARRFRLADGESAHRYLALYEMETDDPKREIAALATAAGTERMRLSDALDLANVSTTLFELISEHER